jgi:2-dehydro-3-deoxygluconokinase
MAQPVKPADVVAVGETMIMMVPEDGNSLSHSNSFATHIGGAESNVAMNLARLGLSVRWASVMSEDPLGKRVAREIAEAGVDVSAIVWRRSEQTGVYLKDPGAEATQVYYYRQGSAARLLDESIWLDERLQNARVLHLSGITPAISESARTAIEGAILHRYSHPESISFDVNYRPGLWSIEQAAPILQRLAGAADIVFVGLDEAQTLWGCSTAEAVRAKLPNVSSLIVKDGAIGAHAFTSAGRVFMPSRRVNVVEPVGAGDAFAAGFIKGIVDGIGTAKSLRLGHLLAARALAIHSDVPEPPSAGWLSAQLDLSDEDWSRDSLAVHGAEE